MQNNYKFQTGSSIKLYCNVNLFFSEKQNLRRHNIPASFLGVPIVYWNEQLTKNAYFIQAFLYATCMIFPVKYISCLRSYKYILTLFSNLDGFGDTRKHQHFHIAFISSTTFKIFLKGIGSTALVNEDIHTMPAAG